MTIEWHASPNFWTGRLYGPPIAIVIHTMAGTIDACDQWFQNPQSQVSAHYGVALNGDIHAYVRSRDTAWANGLLEVGNAWPGPGLINPNWLTCSIETEDLGNPEQEVTDEQFSSVRTLVRTLHARHPSIIWLMGHDTITPLSRNHCPGARWWDSGRIQQLVDETELSSV
jgi:N-acetylmuramoyl-L-alanine amidase